jgi:hypothetical protein
MVKVERFMHKGRNWTRYFEPPYQQWVVGCDLGKRVDYTALNAMQHTREPLDDWEVDEVQATTRQKVVQRFAVRGLQRLPLGMDYTIQGERIRELLLAPPLRGDADLVIDDSSIGEPVCDQLVAHGRLNPVRVTLHGMSNEVIRKGYRRFSVPKMQVISHLDARLGSGELVFADDLDLKEVASDELTNFQRHITAAGRSTFEARSGKHDDIVLSIGFALWWAVERRRHQIHTGRLRGLY